MVPNWQPLLPGYLHLLPAGAIRIGPPASRMHFSPPSRRSAAHRVLLHARGRRGSRKVMVLVFQLETLNTDQEHVRIFQRSHMRQPPAIYAVHVILSRRRGVWQHLRRTLPTYSATFASTPAVKYSAVNMRQPSSACR